MTVMELTLGKLKFANVYGFERDFGTKKNAMTNGGSLTTMEFNEANALPFDLMRPTLINEDTNIITLDYDARLNLFAPSEITLTLGTGSYIGQTCSVFNSSNVSHKVSVNGKIVTITAKNRIKYEWYGDEWVSEDSIAPIGFVYAQFPGEPSPLDLNYYGTWKELKMGGVFIRSVGGDALPFTGKFKCSVSDNSVTLTQDDADTLEYENLLSSCDATKLIVIAGDEYRSITAWDRSTHTITLDSAFTDYSNITTVLIGQHEGLPNITASATNGFVDHSLHTALRNLKGALCSGGLVPKSSYSDAPPASSGGYYHDEALIIDASEGETKTDGTYINDVYGKSDHLQTNNITVKYWKRID